MSDVVTLDDLVRPIGVERFVTEHWLPEVPFLSAPNPELVARLRTFEALSSPEALCSRLTKDVVLFGPNQFRGKCGPSEALGRLRDGFTLYVLALEQQVPELRRLATATADALGMANMAVNIEAFVARAGSVSSGHFDHDINFQILLEGSKRWHVAENRHVRNPMQPYHPARQPDGTYIAALDEAYARDLDVPTQMPAPDRVFEPAAGTVIFIPRAWWHEVESITDCFAINIGVKGPTWANGFSAALGDLLSGEELAREYCYGALAHAPETKDHVVRRFEQLRARAIQHLQNLTLEEVYLAGKTAVWRWAPAASDRAIVQTASGWALDVPAISPEPLELDDVLLGLVRKLVRLKRPFDWGHLAVIATEEIRGEIGAVGLWNLLTDLVEAGYLVRVSGELNPG